MNKISIIGYVTGIIAIILAIQRYWFVYDDPFKMILGIGIGVGILGVSYLYNWMKIIDKKFLDVDEQILTLNAWNTKQNLKEEFK